VPVGRLRGLLVVLLLLGSGCALFDIEAGPRVPEAFDDGVPEVPQPAEGHTVPLELTQAALDGVLAVVPVTIAGEGPYSFVLDTGATSSTIDASLASELGLEETGLEGDVAGVTGQAVGTAVAVESWQLGDVELGAQELISLDLGGVDGGLGVDGLLGSDVLAGFGTVTIDYAGGVLLLGSDEE
jgi:predicted aspartyl protease